MLDRTFAGRFEEHRLSERVRLRLAPTRKFKTALVKVFVRTDLDAATATEVAALPYVLRHGTRSLPSKRELTRSLEALYGASLGVDVLKLGEQQVISLSLQVLGDRFLPPGERVFERGLRILCDLLCDPALDEQGALRAEAVRQEKEKLRRFIEGLINDKGSYAAQRCIERMCRDEPYGVFEYGRLSDLAAVDGAALEARRRALLAEAPIDVYVVGAVEAERARQAIAEALRLP
ncbi:MAG: insulinase family protein, partial [Planctomycetota bacterium]